MDSLLGPNPVVGRHQRSRDRVGPRGSGHANLIQLFLELRPIDRDAVSRRFALGFELRKAAATFFGEDPNFGDALSDGAKLTFLFGDDLGDLVELCCRGRRFLLARDSVQHRLILVEQLPMVLDPPLHVAPSLFLRLDLMRRLIERRLRLGALGVQGIDLGHQLFDAAFQVVNSEVVVLYLEQRSNVRVHEFSVGVCERGELNPFQRGLPSA